MSAQKQFQYLILNRSYVCRSAWELPGWDLIAAGDDMAGDPRQSDGVLDVLSSLAKVGAWDGDSGAPLNGSRQRLNLKQVHQISSKTATLISTQTNLRRYLHLIYCLLYSLSLLHKI